MSFDVEMHVDPTESLLLEFFRTVVNTERTAIKRDAFGICNKTKKDFTIKCGGVNVNLKAKGMTHCMLKTYR